MGFYSCLVVAVVVDRKSARKLFNHNCCSRKQLVRHAVVSTPESVNRTMAKWRQLWRTCHNTHSHTHVGSIDYLPVKITNNLHINKMKINDKSVGVCLRAGRRQLFILTNGKGNKIISKINN